MGLGGGPGTSHICHITSWAAHFSWAPASSWSTGCHISCTWDVGTKKPTFRIYQGHRNHHKEATSPEVGILPSQYPMLAKHRLIWGPHPNSLLQSTDLIPQALQRGVPSSASLQSGVLWVLQEAQRRGPEKAEAKGQSQAKSPGSGGLCGVRKFGTISVKAPPGSGPASRCCRI